MQQIRTCSLISGIWMWICLEVLKLEAHEYARKERRNEPVVKLALPTYWLHDLAKQEKPGWEPMMAMQSSVNWMRALGFEITQEHGNTCLEQINSCQTHFSGNVQRRRPETQPAHVWGPIFHSLIFCLSLGSLCERGATGPWMLPSAIIMNYYASYNAVLAILAAQNDFKGETHSKAIGSLNTVRRLLPHPLDMVASRMKGESYAPVLPKYPDTIKSDLTTSFAGTREDARGKILSYVKGTADWKADEIKDRLKRDKKIDNFRTKANQEIRDKHLPDEINYLNCAFRYRGKANYRDSIFLAYGEKHKWLGPEFMDDLRIVATFCFACALTYAHKRLGEEHVRHFLKDIGDHLRGSDNAAGRELFWKDLASYYQPEATGGG